MKTLVKVLALVLANLVVAGLMGELVVRMIYEPGDYLEGGTLEDEVLEFKLQPDYPGHDAWGFRNVEVPETVDILALGDSWTYGLEAPASETWPSWLHRSTHQTVYNLGIYGYGPTDYLHLLKTRGLSLEPKVIVLGFSISTDLPQAYRNVYSNDRWRYLRSDQGRPREEKVAAERRGKEENQKKKDASIFIERLYDIRFWLRGHSLLFKIIENGPIGKTVNAIVAAHFKTENPTRCVMRTSPPFETYVDPMKSLRPLNLSDPRTREGLDLSLAILREIAETATSEEIRFVVALFPTKERVFVGRLAEAERTDCVENFDRLMEMEAQVVSRIKSFLEANGIEYVDGLPPLIRASQESRIFVRSPSVHPNGDGYRVISDAIEEHLSKFPPET